MMQAHGYKYCVSVICVKVMFGIQSCSRSSVFNSRGFIFVAIDINISVGYVCYASYQTHFLALFLSPHFPSLSIHCGKSVIDQLVFYYKIM